jgi:hypothetical protein
MKKRQSFPSYLFIRTSNLEPLGFLAYRPRGGVTGVITCEEMLMLPSSA